MSGGLQHLQNRDGRWFARMAVPVALWPSMGKRELRQFLDTDKAAAKAKLHGVVAGFQAAIAQAQAKLDGADKPARPHHPLTLPQLARIHYAERMQFDDELRSEDDRYASVALDDCYVADLRRAVSGAASDAELTATLELILAKFEARGNLDATPGTRDWRTIARGLAGVELEALSRVAERDEGDYTGTPKHPLLTEPAEPEAKLSTPATKGPTSSIGGLFDAYLKELAASGKGAAAGKRWGPCVRDFQTMLEHDDASRVTRADVVRWKDRLLDRLAPLTINNVNLAGLRAVFRWAADNGHLTANPFDGVRAKAGKAKRTREKGFTDAEAEAVLQAASTYEPPHSDNPQTRERPHMTAAKRWVPWLCAHTGARVVEITQLRGSDIRTERGVTYVRITPDAGSVKTGQYRDVPLHPQLIERGFTAYAEAAGGGPLFYAESKRAAGAQHAAQTVSQRIAKWVRDLDVIDVAVDPSHGWRHRFKTVGREQAIDPRVLDAMQGHAARTAGEDYGDVTLRAKAAAIAKMPAYVLPTPPT